jgi:glyoxylase-like metal-dependent hydrolase (beta-lactamase superfamily II)
MFGNVPRPVWSKWLSPDPLGRIHLNCRCLLLQIKGKNILLETGIGQFFEPKLRERFGVLETSHVLLDSLQNHGIDPNDIDYVILSHLHFDHAGGLLTAYQPDHSLGLLFPNAKYVVGLEAFTRAEQPHPRDKASYIPGLVSLLKESGRLILITGKNHPDLFPESISFFFTHGHTPGQMHTVISHQQKRLIFAGDLIPGTAWIHLPVTMGYDRFAERVIDEKKELYDTMTTSVETWFFYTHDLHCAMSMAAKDSTGRMNPMHACAEFRNISFDCDFKTLT